MTDKYKYKLICEKEGCIPIFAKAWWLDAVAGEDSWDVILVEKGGEIVGAMPYCFKKRKKYLYIDEPYLTHKNYIWIKNAEGKKQKYIMSIIDEIAIRLESLNLGGFHQSLSYNFNNWLPFYWRGFSQTTKYSYVIDNIKNLERVYSNFDSKLKQNINKAKAFALVYEDLDIDSFYKLNSMIFERQSIKIPYTLEQVKRIDEACKARGCRKIFYAKDSSNNLCAAIYVVWDENSAYYLMSGEDTKYRNNQSEALLIWKAIENLCSKTESFDFCGSMLKNVECYMRKFGGELRPYSIIYKDYHKRSTLNAVLRAIYINNKQLQNITKRFMRV